MPDANPGEQSDITEYLAKVYLAGAAGYTASGALSDDRMRYWRFTKSKRSGRLNQLKCHRRNMRRQSQPRNHRDASNCDCPTGYGPGHF